MTVFRRDDPFVGLSGTSSGRSRPEGLGEKAGIGDQGEARVTRYEAPALVTSSSRQSETDHVALVGVASVVKSSAPTQDW